MKTFTNEDKWYFLSLINKRLERGYFFNENELKQFIEKNVHDLAYSPSSSSGLSLIVDKQIEYSPASDEIVFDSVEKFGSVLIFILDDFERLLGNDETLEVLLKNANKSNYKGILLKNLETLNDILTQRIVTFMPQTLLKLTKDIDS